MTHLVVIGAGMAGLPCAIRAADAGAQVTLIESADDVGGKLPRSSGQISAAGTRLQAEKGIVDSADDHFAEVMRICHETADPNVVRLAVNHAAATVDWLLDIGVPFPPDHPVISYNHDVYRTRRYQWPVKKGKSILAALRPLLAAHIKAGRIDLHLNTAMTAIDRDAEGAVTAIRVQDAGGAGKTLQADAYVLTCGGYTNDPALFRELTPRKPLFAARIPISSGKAMRVAQAAGLQIDGGDHYMGMLGGVLMDPDDPLSVTFALNTVPQDRPPWEIWVNMSGERFTREDHPSATHREHAVNAQDNLTFFIVFDEGIRQNAPLITATNDAALKQLIDANYSYMQGDTIADLAQKMGVVPDRLANTIDHYNQVVAMRHDTAFGRESLPRAIDTPPYYAIQSVAFAMPSPAGVAVDGDLHALDTDGRTVPNLFAAGEFIGNTRVMGNAYVSGMGVGPTVTFGRLLGDRLALR
ncbi:MAG: FAD-dependent oxidoreductase [Alphaproteobacteria bacterium]|nr:FAD-dependent oxidoreductase [Alphaproteobacteria bacterium]